MLDSLQLLSELVAVPGPPGQEDQIREAVRRHVSQLGYESQEDAKGNLLVPLKATGSDSQARLLVTAHLDELALMVSHFEPDGRMRVIPLGGLAPYKWGEQPVEVWTETGPLPGVISFGSTHSNSPEAVAQQARSEALRWEQAHVFTGRTTSELAGAGVRPGVRVTLARSRRTILEMGQHVASYFLDDRADLVAWLLALEMLKDTTLPGAVLFAATAAEEVGGEGASYLMHSARPEICIALEIGPHVPECRLPIDDQPTVWVTDSFSSMAANDAAMVNRVCQDLGLRPHWQALSRGGSDASCAAHTGLTARPITLGLPVENSHGYEIMHRDAMANLARLTVALLNAL